MFIINIDTTSDIPLYEQIYSYIKNEINMGALSYQTKLPSTRSLAAHLQLSRNTVDMAYSQLLSEGYIESIPKKGYFVTPINGQYSIKTIPQIKEDTTPPLMKEDCLYDFSPFSIDLDHFPYHTWQKLSKYCLSETKDLFLLGNKQGDLPFRQAIKNYLHQSRGVNCSVDQIIVGAGADYLLQLLTSLLPSDSILAMENPAYKQAYHIFSGLKKDTRAISLDQYGINMEDLDSSGANIAYVTPSHQYPLGVVMPIKRRIELLDWASKDLNRYIIEDDHDSEFRYKGKPIPALQGIDSKEKVVYLGTFSRAIAPAIRIGYMVLPSSLLRIYQTNFGYYSSTVSRVDQAIMTKFMEDGYFERHLSRMRKIYKNKHDLVLNALKQFGSHISIEGENAGLHLVIHLDSDRTEQNIIDTARLHKIKLYGLSEHFIIQPETKSATLLLGYANLTDSQIKDGIKLLYSIYQNDLNKEL